MEHFGVTLLAKGLTTASDRENWVMAGKGIGLKASVIDGEAGVFAEGSLVLENVQVGEDAGGLAAVKTVRGHDVTLAGSTSVVGKDISLTRVTAVPDQSGVASPLLSAERHLRLRNSAVTSIESGLEPVLIRTTCTMSNKFGSSETWGVCTDD